MKHRLNPGWLLAVAALPVLANEPAVTALTVPAIAGVVAADSQLQLIKDGFNGTEGPISAKDGSLLFTETRANRIVRIDQSDQVKTYLEQSNGANGLGYLPRGELVAVQVNNNQVGILKPHFKPISRDYQGRPYQRTNDLVVSSKGDIYFTDSGPANQPANTQANTQTNPNVTEQPQAAAPVTTPSVPPHTAVYHVRYGGNSKQLVADNQIKRPNGIALSRDEKTLYIANSAGPDLLKLDLTVADAKPVRFAPLAGASHNPQQASGADGITIDEAGRVLVATNAGIEVFSEHGAALGVIPLPKKPQNLAFAGPDKQTLYIVGRGAVYKLATLTKGFSGRAK